MSAKKNPDTTTATQLRPSSEASPILRTPYVAGLPKPGFANRLNAQKSTGPRTEEGKQRASLNATRHGLTAQVLTL